MRALRTLLLTILVGVEPAAAWAGNDAALADAATGEPNRTLAAIVSGGVLVGSALNSFSETPHESFHIAHEGFFGRDTSAGGADKASHFVDYGVLGYPRGRAILMAAAVAGLAGLVTELGDGTTFFGFSFEDLVMDVLGAGTSALHGRPEVRRTGAPRRRRHRAPSLLALLGDVRALHYDSASPGDRERLVGFEVGLNLAEVLDDIGVRRNTWWGYALHVVFDNLRILFTAVGVRYGLNHGKWRGPS